jgi:hypothetical protein
VLSLFNNRMHPIVGECRALLEVLVGTNSNVTDLVGIIPNVIIISICISAIAISKLHRKKKGRSDSLDA